jgi:hypothetical protein
MAQWWQRCAVELGGGGGKNREKKKRNDGVLALLKGSLTVLAC